MKRPKLSSWSFVFLGFGVSSLVIGATTHFTPLRTIVTIFDFSVFLGMNIHINLRKR